MTRVGGYRHHATAAANLEREIEAGAALRAATHPEVAQVVDHAVARPAHRNNQVERVSLIRLFLPRIRRQNVKGGTRMLPVRPANARLACPRQTLGLDPSRPTGNTPVW